MRVRVKATKQMAYARRFDVIALALWTKSHATSSFSLLLLMPFFAYQL